MDIVKPQEDDMLIDKLTTTTVSSSLPYLNTGTIFDISNGRFTVGFDGKWYLDGGISIFTGVAGRPQTYKSSVAGSMVARALNIYPDSVASILETENTIADKQRYDDFVENKVSERIIFNNLSTMTLTDFHEHVKEIIELKKKDAKNFTVETPFIDTNTGKRKKIFVPTILLIDSYSKAISSRLDNLVEDTKTKIDDSNLNTLYMQEGLMKSRFLSFLSVSSVKYGLYCFFTSHIGEKKDIGVTPTPKQLQYMNQKDRLRNVGSEFEYLMTTLLQTKSASVLMNSAKERCRYGYRGQSPINEVSEINATSIRGKSLGSGYSINYVCSQYEGILADVTNYHFLRNLPKDKQVLTPEGRNGFKFPGGMLPDVTLHDHDLRETLKGNYEIRRGLEILTQLVFMQQHWPLFKLPDFVGVNALDVAELLTKSTDPLISDVLNSTGTWTYGESERPYMSVFDILEKITKDKKVLPEPSTSKKK